MTWILSLFFPQIKDQKLEARHPSVMHHIRQIERARIPEIPESAAGRAQTCKLVATSGRFIGLGTEIVPAP